MNNQPNLPNFSQEDIKRVLGSGEGKALLALLNRDGGKLLRQAAEAVKQGDMQRARELLAPTMEQPEIAALVDKINGKQA